MCPELCLTSKMKRFAKIVNRLNMPLNIFAKSTMLDIWQGSECTSENINHELGILMQTVNHNIIIKWHALRDLVLSLQF